MNPVHPHPRAQRFRHLASCWLLAGLVSAGAALPASTAWSADRALAGVKVPETQTLAGTDLRLNGAGIRFRGPFRVYTAALYTAAPVTTANAFHAQPGAKRLVLTMLREVDSTDLGRLFIRGIEKNMPRTDVGEVMTQLARMGEIFAANKRMQPGEQLVIDWVPASGMQITARGQRQGDPFPSAAFYQAMMNIWLGPSPADWPLKDALLGQTPAQDTYRR